MIYYELDENKKIKTWTKSKRMADLLGLSLTCEDNEIETNDNYNWYLKGTAPQKSEIEIIYKQLKSLEKETGYNRLTRDLYFNLKKLGGVTNPNVYKKMLEIDALAKKYRKQLKQEQKTEDGDLEN